MNKIQISISISLLFVGCSEISNSSTSVSCEEISPSWAFGKVQEVLDPMYASEYSEISDQDYKLALQSLSQVKQKVDECQRVFFTASGPNSSDEEILRNLDTAQGLLDISLDLAIILIDLEFAPSARLISEPNSMDWKSKYAAFLVDNNPRLGSP